MDPITIIKRLVNHLEATSESAANWGVVLEETEGEHNVANARVASARRYIEELNASGILANQQATRQYVPKAYKGTDLALEECFACIPPVAPVEPTLAEMLADRDAWCLVWYEPQPGTDADGTDARADTQITASVRACIRMRRRYQRSMRPGHVSTAETDEDLLADFIAVNWARVVPVRREDHEIDVERVGGAERPHTGTDPLRTSLD